MSLGRLLLTMGLVIAGIGLLIEVAPSLRLGRLPGDLSFGGSGWRVYFPFGTSVLISIVLTVVLMLVGALTRR